MRSNPLHRSGVKTPKYLSLLSVSYVMVVFLTILAENRMVMIGSFFVAWLKNTENLDVYDLSTKFNPFSTR